MSIKLVIGLRNPGASYEQTRHNAGAWFVQAVAEKAQCNFRLEKKLHAEIADCFLYGYNFKLVLPTTFMNNSGLPVQAISKYYNITTEDILIAYDDLDLPAGSVRFKQSAGHGGHNGLRDILQCLGNSTFQRLRFGISHPGHKDLVLNYVLGKPSKEDRQLIQAAIDKSIAVLPELLAQEYNLAMNHLHR